ncbi:CDP-glucose 4,6-dehydratase [Clostridium sporogenes]|uniref:CDP-glucose 4,6-dehydratase RfbG n=1 Tax=Clostridium sporogenes TaxID=1509 RepID=A0A7U4LP52_CLOSG|nr:CDP-glucose 4,6-dehydratase [Clostridium sporogenes]AVP60146.1 CDP-glucose 4,6-dehydratase [Clostridium botulinum]AKC63509.1 CDP-glucose 4,6-dehydratase RfbG [Clostridium sporogenes]AKJ90676.1 CDP-glucose 4,6-dehydratase [Clostridium sporogenes]KCZ67207.1 CDP-glucose 4,6-dehydratase RfbG [Clostridium sporogenes]KRU43334.1 CDP-glucose 4,6-dehydratase [Clostridium sporogenes]
MNRCFYNTYKNKRVLVTGATGFKGSWLSIWLNRLGAKVIGYSLEPPTKTSMFEICNLGDKIINIIGDVRDYFNLLNVFKEYKPEIIFHLAAQPLVRLSYKCPIDTYETNVMGTVNLLEAAKNTDSVKSVLVITSDKCYENKEWIYGYREDDPIGGYDPYSSSKGCSELVVSSYINSFYNGKGIALSSARAGNVIGGGDWAEDRLIPDFVRAVSEDKSIFIRNPLAIRPWQHVLEPLSGYLLLGALMFNEPKKYNSAWNFGPKDEDALNVEEILKLSINSWGKGSIKLAEEYKYHEANLLKLDISKARAYLKWRPVYDVNKAVQNTINWYKTYYENKDENMYEYTLKQIYEYEKRARDLSLIWSE